MIIGDGFAIEFDLSVEFEFSLMTDDSMMSDESESTSNRFEVEASTESLFVFLETLFDFSETLVFLFILKIKIFFETFDSKLCWHQQNNPFGWLLIASANSSCLVHLLPIRFFSG